MHETHDAQVGDSCPTPWSVVVVLVVVADANVVLVAPQGPWSRSDIPPRLHCRSFVSIATTRSSRARPFAMSLPSANPSASMASRMATHSSAEPRAMR